jgi:hypothetical protein
MSWVRGPKSYGQCTVHSEQWLVTSGEKRVSGVGCQVSGAGLGVRDWGIAFWILGFIPRTQNPAPWTLGSGMRSTGLSGYDAGLILGHRPA